VPSLCTFLEDKTNDQGSGEGDRPDYLQRSFAGSSEESDPNRQDDYSGQDPNIRVTDFFSRH
jgi:hypothetical protein